jgi:BMFP domain-containing protein YqiC
MKKEKVFEDLIKVSGGILKSLDGAKDYSREKLKRKLSKSLENLDFAKKADLELIKNMCVSLKEENAKLSRKINILEKKIIKSK